MAKANVVKTVATVANHPKVVEHKTKLDALVKQRDEKKSRNEDIKKLLETAKETDGIDFTAWDSEQSQGDGRGPLIREYNDNDADIKSLDAKIKLGREMLFHQGPWGRSIQQICSVEVCKANAPILLEIVEEAIAAMKTVQAPFKRWASFADDLKHPGDTLIIAPLVEPFGYFCDSGDSITWWGVLVGEYEEYRDQLREFVASQETSDK